MAAVGEYTDGHGRMGVGQRECAYPAGSIRRFAGKHPAEGAASPSGLPPPSAAPPILRA